MVEELIDFMQIQDIRDEPVEVIPLGMQKRVELARALAAEPSLLILDEPMAGMNQEEKEYIARFILDARQERNTTILLIEHHMDVVTALCDQVLVLSYGEKIAEGEPARNHRRPARRLGLSRPARRPTARGGGVMNMPLLQRPVVTSWPVTPDGQPATLVAALARNAAEAGARIAFRERDRGVWQERSWSDIFAEVMALAAAFEALGLGPGPGADGDRRQPGAPLYFGAGGDGAARISFAGLS